MVQINTIQESGVLGDLYIPEHPQYSAVVVLIHGGGWTSMGREAMSGIADMLVEHGIAALNIEYHLAPQYPYPVGMEDCRNAIQWLAVSGCLTYGLSSKRIFVLGASAGGHYALLSSLLLPPGSVAGIISISGITDTFIDYEAFPERYALLFGRKPDEQDLALADPKAFYYDGAPPILCTHYCEDEVVPCECTRAFVANVEARGGRIRHVIYDFNRRGEGHAIWQPGSQPHRLYADLEAHVLSFIGDICTGTLA